MIWLSVFNWTRSVIGRSVPATIIPSVDLLYSDMARVGALDDGQDILHHVSATDDFSDIEPNGLSIGHAADMVVVRSAKGFAHVMRGTNGTLVVSFNGVNQVHRYACAQLFEHTVLVKLGVSLSTVLRNSGV